jgi:hypothetical protein
MGFCVPMWLGSKNYVTDLSPVKESRESRYALGVIGSRSRSTYDTMQVEIIQPLIEAWGLPVELIIPSDGDSSHVLMLWAQQKDIPIQMISSDWALYGKRAAMIRDTTIQRESTRLLFLQGPRSTTLEKTANRLAKKGRSVALSDRPGNPLTIIEGPK